MCRGRPTLLDCFLLFGLAAGPAGAARADDPAPVDKSGYGLFNPVPESALRSFSTDRPPKANSSYTVDAGHFQYETDLAVFGRGTSQGTATTAWTLLDPTLKLGITSSVDAELQVTPYQRAASGSAPTLSGMGDTVARLKWNVEGNDGGARAIALLPYLVLPTARPGLGAGRVEGGLIVPITWSVAGGFTVVAMPEVDVLRNPGSNGYHLAWDALVNLRHPITATWTLYGELFTSRPLGGGVAPGYSFDSSLTYAMTPSLQWDVGCNLGLNATAPRLQVYSGLSQRF